MTKKNSLYPQKEIEIDVKALILMSFLFFVLAFLLGFAFRHYPSIQSVI